ncbi:MAG: hypothetical protein ACI4B5_07785 [Bacteroidaceae bacterium]
MDASIVSTSASESKSATFTATPKTGYEFAGWGTSADATSYESTSNPYSTTITNSTPGSTANKTLYAIFKPVFNFTATADKINGNYGEVSATITPKIVGNPTDTSKSTQATFTATPNANCTFHGWYYDAAHTQKASDATTYTEEITNNQIGSTANLTLYAWFKSNQTLTFTSSTYDPNIVKGTTVTGAAAATASSGLPVTYSSSNDGVVSVDGNGNVKGESLSNNPITITATQVGDDEYNPAFITREFYVISKKVTGFTPSVNLSTIRVGDQPTITVKDEGEGFTYSSSAPDVVGISKSGDVITLTALKVGESTITLSQPETTTHSAVTQTYSITVEKVANTLELGLSSQSAQVDGSITVYTGKQNNTETPIVASITDQNLPSPVNNGEDVIVYEDGVIKAKNAGTAKITFTQAETDKYTGFTSTTFDITVTKIANPITVSLNGGSATSIKLKYGKTATLGYSSAHSDVPIMVAKTSGSFTTLTGNTITAGNEAGTDLYEVVQEETYKYEAGYAAFSVRVNDTNEEEGYVFTGWTDGSSWSGMNENCDITLSGPPAQLRFDARKSGAGTCTLYYSTDGTTWEKLATQDIKYSLGGMAHYEIDIPNRNARYIRFYGSSSIHHYSNVYVTRKTYLEASSNKTDFDTVYTGNIEQATVTVNYSTTNGGNIQVNSSNTNFAVTTTEIATANNSDATMQFTVTYTPNPNQLGGESAVITVSDLFYAQQITLTATAAKRANTLTVIDNQSIMVDDEVLTVYSEKNSDAEITYSLSKDGVIEYDAVNNKVKAVGAGEATLSLTQPENDTHLGITKRVTFTVSKHGQTLSWDKELSSEELILNVGETLTTNTATASSRLAVVYSTRNSNVLQVNPATGELKALSAGANIAVTATQPGNYKYNEASITRYFTVISKMDATVITSLSEEETNILTIGEAPVTIGSNATLTESNFTITGNEGGYIETSFASNTLTITPVKAGGEVTITLTRAEDDGYNAISKTYTLTVQGPSVVLSPTIAPEIQYPGIVYHQITLQRTFNAGHSTITLPFDTDINALAVGDASAYVAQLELVTYNKADGYTLYFKKVENGTILANQPYLIYLNRSVASPIVFENVTAVQPQAADVTKNGWTMHGNYTPGTSMNGRYGIAGGKLCLGSSSATLNAYTAYFEAPTTQSVKVRVAVEDGSGNTTWLGETGDDGEAVEAVYGLDGMKLGTMRQGVNIVRQKDGTVKKVWKK